jgi:hypothetical protein
MEESHEHPSQVDRYSGRDSRHAQPIYNAGFEVLRAVVMKSTVFCDITPCSPLKVNRRFGGTYLLHLRGFLLFVFLTLKMEAICSPETSVDFQRTARRYIPE